MILGIKKIFFIISSVEIDANNENDEKNFEYQYTILTLSFSHGLALNFYAFEKDKYVDILTVNKKEIEKQG